MVEQATLNSIFKSLADPTRRDILARVYERQQTITELAKKYRISFAATAKHINVLQTSGLVSKTRSGKEQIITINGESFSSANEYLQNYAALWSDSFDKLETILEHKT